MSSNMSMSLKIRNFLGFCGQCNFSNLLFSVSITSLGASSFSAAKKTHFACVQKHHFNSQSKQRRLQNES
jgi:hypothetical protein